VRIAVISPPWVPVPPPAYGGTEAVIDRLARGFLAAGHEVLLFATGDSTCAVDRRWVFDQADGLRMGLAVPELHHLVHAYDAVRGFDVVHDHTVVGPVYAERFPDQLVVTTNHGPFVEELATIYRAVAHRVPIIAISHAQAATAGDIPIAGVILHGIDPERFPVGKGDGGYFAFLGRMAPDKGARRAAIVARDAGVRLLIAAKMQEPLEQQYFQQQVEPILGDGVEYIGEVDVEGKMRLLGGAHALLNPIRWAEPFGLVMLEALACGTPVVAFPEGAAPEIVDDGVTGFLCDDEADMVSKLPLVHDLDRAACRRVAERRFSTKRMVREHVALFEDLLSQRG